MTTPVRRVVGLDRLRERRRVRRSIMVPRPGQGMRSYLRAIKLCDRREEALGVGGGVVVQESGADGSVGGEAEDLLELPGVVVAVPDGDLALVQGAGDLGGREAANV